MLTKAQFDNIKRIRDELQAYMETIQIVPLEDLQQQIGEAHTEYEDDFYAKDEDWREASGGQKVERELEELETVCSNMHNAVDSTSAALREIEEAIDNLTKFLGE
jgi:predicted  nucleic acid-binding Zn-ribbon protein